MASASVTIRMDKDLKERFAAFCEDAGMSVTTAYTVFAKKVVRENRIPFEISTEIPNVETLEAIEEVRRMKEDPSLGKTYKIETPADVHDMIEDMLEGE